MATRARTQRRGGWPVGGVLIAVLLPLSSCSWQRYAANEKILDFDFDSVQPGRTTLREVLMAFGLPPPDDPQEIGVRSTNRQQIRYATLDRRCAVLGFESILLITPFRWCAGVRTYEVSLEFDAQGVVTRVVSTRRQAYWPPFQDKSELPPVSVIRTAGAQR